MSKAIKVLEQLGSNAAFQNEQAIEQLLTATKVNAEQAEAIINKDVTSLERQLDVRLDVVCGVFPAEDDDEEKDDDKDDEGSTEATSIRVVGF
jgi:hypothetical protein